MRFPRTICSTGFGANLWLHLFQLGVENIVTEHGDWFVHCTIVADSASEALGDRTAGTLHTLGPTADWVDTMEPTHSRSHATGLHKTLDLPIPTVSD